MPWFFDYYEIRARIAPTIVVLSPVILAFLIISFVIVGSWLTSLGVVTVVALMLVYTFSFLPRQLGKRIEPKLWTDWDGAPTTRMLRWRDQTLDIATKRQMRERAQQISGVELPSQAEEDTNRDEADRRISQAYVQVRNILRREVPDDLSVRHNAEYGFNRNLLGSKWVWLATSVLSVLACAVMLYFYVADSTQIVGLLVVGLVLEILSIALAYLFGWYLLPESVKAAADRYAESALSYLLSSREGD